MKRILFLLLAVGGIGHAQIDTIAVPGRQSSCWTDGRLPWSARPDGTCHIEDSVPGNVTMTGASMLIMATPPPKCREGYTLVNDGARVRCAKDLIDPE